MASVDEIVEDYFAAWNATESSKRAQVLERIWPEDGMLLTPRVGPLSGPQAIMAHISGFSQRFPGARVLRTGVIDTHHNVCRYTWAHSVSPTLSSRAQVPG